MADLFGVEDLGLTTVASGDSALSDFDLDGFLLGLSISSVEESRPTLITSGDFPLGDLNCFFLGFSTSSVEELGLTPVTSGDSLSDFNCFFLDFSTSSVKELGLTPVTSSDSTLSDFDFLFGFSITGESMFCCFSLWDFSVDGFFLLGVRFGDSLFRGTAFATCTLIELLCYLPN